MRDGSISSIAPWIAVHHRAGKFELHIRGTNCGQPTTHVRYFGSRDGAMRAGRRERDKALTTFTTRQAAE